MVRGSEATESSSGFQSSGSPAPYSTSDTLYLLVGSVAAAITAVNTHAVCALLRIKGYTIRITVSNTVRAETFDKTMLERVCTYCYFRVLQGMIRRVVNGTIISHANGSLVHLPHHICVICKAV